MLIKELITSSNYWTLNKSVVKELGIETAFLLSVLAEAETILADENGWFYQTSNTIEDITGMTNYIQTKCINSLIERGMLIQENRGIPMKRYFKLNYESIQNQVFKKLENQFSKNLKTSIQKTSNNKELSNKELIYKELNINIMSCKQDDPIPYSEIIDYLNLRTGSNYRHTTKKTKDLIKARFNEKFTLDDFKTVIDKKTIEWINKPEMVGFLRPETLFGTKFESYLNQQLKKPVDKYDALNELMSEDNNNDYTGIF